MNGREEERRMEDGEKERGMGFNERERVKKRRRGGEEKKRKGGKRRREERSR